MRTAALFVLTTVLGACSSEPTPPAAYAHSFTARDVIERAIEAQGGAETQTSTRTLSEVELFADAEQDPVLGELTAVVGPNREIRLQLETEDGRRLLQLFDGEQQREWENGVLSNRDLSLEANRRRNYGSMLRLFRDGQPRICKVERFDDGDDQIVLELQEDPDKWMIWVDSRTHHLSRILWSTPFNDDRLVMEDWLFEYREYLGRWIPTRTVRTRNNTKIMELRLLERERALDLPDNYFREVEVTKGTN